MDNTSILEQNKTQIHLEYTSNITPDEGVDNSTERHFFISRSQISFVITGVIYYSNIFNLF